MGADSEWGAVVGSGVTTIVNVQVFTGDGLSELSTVVIGGGVIVSVTADAGGEGDGDVVVDGGGGTLMPGLIDSHVHLFGAGDLERASTWGVTTMLDMGAPSMELIAGLRAVPDAPTIRTAGLPASAPGGVQTTRMGFARDSVVTGPGDAERFVAARVADGVDYIKIIAEDPAAMGAAALDGPTIDALVIAAHTNRLRAYAHVTTVAAAQLAATAWVDVLTHVALDAVLPAALVTEVAAKGLVSVPTLVMMRGVAEKAGGASGDLVTHRGAVDFAHAVASVTALHEAGVAVLAGTDSNSAPGSPFGIAHGESLHDELGLLVEAGLSPVEALRGATVLPARMFDLRDRGAVTPGLRADLVLVEGDPTVDIAATRAIRGVWIAGARVR
ncbi:amidohydrolase family protein [Subtercola sp. RTI3]|uniref:amidohydrolase family protein n=1 Tax=Subtercola sp. RTI3 TaxID=3048639 RepID=UPI002B239F75|nr:amidohydrolase family protein [Subtercola sp. RTI3]MEA9986221.1 amidohydrolase family protein [Subtercola sp. RTI3]